MVKGLQVKVRKSIAFDPRILAKSDYYAEKTGVNRSQLVNYALSVMLGIPYEMRKEAGEDE